MPKKKRPEPVTLAERDRLRFNLFWGRFGFTSHQHEGDSLEWESTIIRHGSLGPLAQQYGTLGRTFGKASIHWRPIFPRDVDTFIADDSEKILLGREAHSSFADWRKAALVSLNARDIFEGHILFSKRQVIEAMERWRDPFITASVSAILKETIRTHTPEGTANYTATI